MNSTNGGHEGYSPEEDDIYWAENEPPRKSNWIKWGVIIVVSIYAATMAITIILSI